MHHRPRAVHFDAVQRNEAAVRIHIVRRRRIAEILGRVAERRQQSGFRLHTVLAGNVRFGAGGLQLRVELLRPLERILECHHERRPGSTRVDERQWRGCLHLLRRHS